MNEKIIKIDEVEELIGNYKSQGKKIIHCHGVFDLLHIGHIKHFAEAKKLGDILVVSITPDHYVNKGPGRPAFSIALRLEALAALESIDYVVANNKEAALISAIEKTNNKSLKISDLRQELDKTLTSYLNAINVTKDNPNHVILKFEKDSDKAKNLNNLGDGEHYQVSFVIEEQQSAQEYKIFKFLTIFTVSFGLLIMLFIKRLKKLAHGAE